MANFSWTFCVVTSNKRISPLYYYFPKEIALYGEFTIRETMQFFGMVNGMTPEQVDEKIEFLLKFLQLPSASRAVKNLRYL